MKPKDYYKVLGVEETAGLDAIKKAYRTLAKQNHPDVHPGDKKAEERFKEISEAYDVLSDARKRGEYDRLRKYGYGAPGGGFDFRGFDGGRRQTGTGPGGGFTFEGFDLFGGLGDLFARFFEGGGSPDFGSGRPHRPDASPAAQAEIRVPFELAALGGRTRVALDRSEPCPACGGGRAARPGCAECGGLGRRTGRTTLDVRLAAGTEDGSLIRLKGQGEPGPDGQPADLIARVRVRPHRFLRRSGRDIACEVPLTARQAASGAEVRVKTVEGKTVRLRVPAGTADGAVFRVPGLGAGEGAGRGDHLVTVRVAGAGARKSRARTHSNP